MREVRCALMKDYDQNAAAVNLADWSSLHFLELKAFLYCYCTRSVVDSSPHCTPTLRSTA